MRRVSDSVRDGVGLAIPQPTEGQRIGGEIKAAFCHGAGALRKRIVS
jgi:hypothetical protein